MSRKRKQLHRKPTLKESKAIVSGRVQDLMSQGWSRRDAGQLCIIELALGGVPSKSPPTRRLLAEHVSKALEIVPVRLAVLAMYGAEEFAEAWRALSVVADPPFATFMAEMAAPVDAVVTAEGRELELIHPDNVRHIIDSLRAEARGDFDDAILSLKQAIRPVVDSHMADLEYMRRHGDTLPPAVWGRWTCSVALRWGEHTQYGFDVGFRLAGLVLRTLGAPDDHEPEWLATRLKWDTLVHDALLFDHGLLDYWLTHEAAPRVLDRAPGVGAWVLAQPTLAEVAGPVEGGALVRDLRTGLDVVVGDVGLAEEQPAGRLLYGRLVQVTGDDRSWFATVPTIMDDPEQAESVLDALDNGADAEQRLRAVYLPLRRDIADPEEDNGRRAREAS